MKETHPRMILKQRIIKELPLLVDRWQSAHPDCLISTAWVVLHAAEELGVTRPAILQHLSDAVHEGRLIEVLTYRTWRVELGNTRLLPPLYAVREKRSGVDVYRMVTERPKSRGSNGTTFITTPDGYMEFLRRQRAAQYKRIPQPRSE